jgi:hypothetical protein
MRALLLVLFLAGCAATPLRPAPERLQPWTIALRDRESDDAYVAVYRAGRARLVFVAAEHSNRVDSPTFRLIREAYANFAFDTVIAEGFETSRGANPPRLFEYAAENGPRADGFVEGGETVPTVLGARDEGAALWGGEPDDLEVKARVLAQGFPPEDLLGLYVLRNIPQWIGERKIEDAGDPRLRALVEAELPRSRDDLELPATMLPGYDDWLAWYRARNGKPLDASFVTEETGPLSDGRFGTNRIAYAVSRVRDAYLHELAVGHLAEGESVLVVFGASHLTIHRPALDAVLGSPCYVGSDLAQAASACR